MGEYLLISEAAKEVKVESHVLRYWEEELHLPIKRNELGHRYYTEEDIQRFKQIKSMKERGLQLKAVKMILKDGRLDTVSSPHMAIEIVDKNDRDKSGQEVSTVTAENEEAMQETREEKAQRLQWILQQLIREAMRENNQEICKEIKESIVKELDYQFRNQEEREEEREQRQQKRDEEYYQKMDELLRKKSRGRFTKQQKEVKTEKSKIADLQEAGKKVKKKKHFLI